MKIRHCYWLAGAALMCSVAMSVNAQDTDLYPTGPAEDAAFIRFVNGGLKQMDIVAADSKAAVSLDETDPATHFMPVKAGSQITGRVSAKESYQDLNVTVSPGEFLTVLGTAGDNNQLSLVLIRETPEDFTAARASLALFNESARCASASVGVVGREVRVFDAVRTGTMARREINPVRISVQLLCDNELTGMSLDFGALEGGERYSLFVTQGASGQRFFYVVDRVG